MRKAPILRRCANICAVAAGALTLLGLARPASAQTPVQERVPESNGDGMDTHLFRPAVDSKGFFSVNGSDILGKNDVSFGLVLDWGRNIVRTRSDRIPIDATGMDDAECEDEDC